MVFKSSTCSIFVLLFIVIVFCYFHPLDLCLFSDFWTYSPLWLRCRSEPSKQNNFTNVQIVEDIVPTFQALGTMARQYSLHPQLNILPIPTTTTTFRTPDKDVEVNSATFSDFLSPLIFLLNIWRFESFFISVFYVLLRNDQHFNPMCLK